MSTKCSHMKHFQSSKTTKYLAWLLNAEYFVLTIGCKGMSGLLNCSNHKIMEFVGNCCWFNLLRLSLFSYRLLCFFGPIWEFCNKECLEWHVHSMRNCFSWWWLLSFLSHFSWKSNLLCPLELLSVSVFSGDVEFW
jgi:hypothetical protein